MANGPVPSCSLAMLSFSTALPVYISEEANDVQLKQTETGENARFQLHCKNMVALLLWPLENPHLQKISCKFDIILEKMQHKV